MSFGGAEQRDPVALAGVRRPGPGRPGPGGSSRPRARRAGPAGTGTARGRAARRGAAASRSAGGMASKRSRVTASATSERRRCGCGAASRGGRRSRASRRARSRSSGCRCPRSRRSRTAEPAVLEGLRRSRLRDADLLRQRRHRLALARHLVELAARRPSWRSRAAGDCRNSPAERRGGFADLPRRVTPEASRSGPTVSPSRS